jgi:hypothetical protein
MDDGTDGWMEKASRPRHPSLYVMMISELNPKHIHESTNPISSLPPFIIMIVMYGIYIKPYYLLQALHFSKCPTLFFNE